MYTEIFQTALQFCLVQFPPQMNGDLSSKCPALLGKYLAHLMKMLTSSDDLQSRKAWNVFFQHKGKN